MAQSALGAALTRAHGQALARLKAETLRQLLLIYPLWRLDDPATYQHLVTAVSMLVEARRSNATALAAAYYQAFRVAEGAAGTVPIALAAPVSAAEIEAVVGATAAAGAMDALRAGMTEEAALQNAFVRLSGAVAREVLNGDRQTIVDTVQNDSHFQGWERVSDGDPCAFCAMLLSRGPVYDEASANFEAHDHCACYAEPVPIGAPWSEKSQQMRDLWERTAYSGEVSGTTNDALNNFRRAIEGRLTGELSNAAQDVAAGVKTLGGQPSISRILQRLNNAPDTPAMREFYRGMEAARAAATAERASTE